MIYLVDPYYAAKEVYYFRRRSTGACLSSRVWCKFQPERYKGSDARSLRDGTLGFRSVLTKRVK